MNELQYRANFVVQLFQAAIAVGTGLVSLALIFSHAKSLNGWTAPQLLALMGIYTIIGAVVASLIQPNMQQLMQDIQQGTFDYVLIKPVDAQVLSSVRQVQIWQMVDFLTGIVILVIALIRMSGAVGGLELVAFLAMIALGATMIYCFWLILTTVAFWVVRMDQIEDLFEGAFAAGRYPVGIYPFWLRFGLTFLVPVAYAVTVPAEAVTGRLDGATMIGTVGLTLLFFAVSRILWRFGLRRYSGASA